jgi:hypothetical protein
LGARSRGKNRACQSRRRRLVVEDIFNGFSVCVAIDALRYMDGGAAMQVALAAGSRFVGGGVCSHSIKWVK